MANVTCGACVLLPLYRGDVARDLTPNERVLLEWLLHESKIPEVDALREQIPFTRVVEGTPALPTYLHLKVSCATPAACKDGHLPGGAVVEDSSGEATGFLDLWVKDGYLEAIEHSWIADVMPQAFPSADQLRPWRPDEIHDLRRMT